MLLNDKLIPFLMQKQKYAFIHREKFHEKIDHLTIKFNVLDQFNKIDSIGNKRKT